MWVTSLDTHFNRGFKLKVEVRQLLHVNTFKFVSTLLL